MTPTTFRQQNGTLGGGPAARYGTEDDVMGETPFPKELFPLLARAWEQGYAACCADDEVARDKQANPYSAYQLESEPTQSAFERYVDASSVQQPAETAEGPKGDPQKPEGE